MVADKGYLAPLSTTAKVTDGDYSDLAGSCARDVTVGVNEKTGGATGCSDLKGCMDALGALVSEGANSSRRTGTVRSRLGPAPF